MKAGEAVRLAEKISRGEYEEALGLEPGAGAETVSRAHLRLLHRFRFSPRVREALNRAKGALLREGDLDRGRRLFGLDRVRDALPFLEAGVADDGTAEDRLILGQSLCQAGRFGEAAAHLARAVALRGTAEDNAWLAVAYERFGAWREAEVVHRRVVALRGSADDFAAHGQALWALGRHREAAIVLRHSAAMNPCGIASELLGRYRAVIWKTRLGEVRRCCGPAVRLALTWALLAFAVGCLVVG
jgi:tetratricopeptide (TPR) repeat protein